MKVLINMKRETTENERDERLMNNFRKSTQLIWREVSVFLRLVAVVVDRLAKGVWQSRENKIMGNIIKYKVSGPLLQAVKFYRDRSACMWVGANMLPLFDIHSGVKQGCAMSAWLFNLDLYVNQQWRYTQNFRYKQGYNGENEKESTQLIRAGRTNEWWKNGKKDIWEVVAALGWPSKTLVSKLLEESHVKSLRPPWRACMKRLMTVDEAKEICRDRSVWLRSL